jgi:hypothetical protein
MATTVATTMATLATMATSVATTAIAAAAVVRAAAATTVAAMMTQTGLRRLFAAQEGNSDNREKDRDAQCQRAIHLRILLLGTKKRKGPKKYDCRPTFSWPQL